MFSTGTGGTGFFSQIFPIALPRGRTPTKKSRSPRSQKKIENPLYTTLSLMFLLLRIPNITRLFQFLFKGFLLGLGLL